MAYAWQLLGNDSEDKDNFPSIKRVWRVVKQQGCPQSLTTTLPTIIPTPDQLKKAFNSTWNPTRKLSFLESVVGWNIGRAGSLSALALWGAGALGPLAQCARRCQGREGASRRDGALGALEHCVHGGRWSVGRDGALDALEHGGRWPIGREGALGRDGALGHGALDALAHWARWPTGP